MRIRGGITILMALVLSACGGGGGGGTPPQSSGQLNNNGAQSSQGSTTSNPSSNTNNGSQPTSSTPSSPSTPSQPTTPPPTSDPAATTPPTTNPPASQPAQIFSAAVANAPLDGATISGKVSISIVGNLIVNAELLPPNDYEPKYGIFAVAADGKSGNMELDTTKLPNGDLSIRISAFNVPAGASGDEIVVTRRTWKINNVVTPPAPPPPPVLPGQITRAQLEACPNGSFTKADFYSCTIGFAPGEQVFTGAPCTYNVDANGTISLSSGTTTITASRSHYLAEGSFYGKFMNSNNALSSFSTLVYDHDSSGRTIKIQFYAYRQTNGQYQVSANGDISGTSTALNCTMLLP